MLQERRMLPKHRSRAAAADWGGSGLARQRTGAAADWGSIGYRGAGKGKVDKGGRGKGPNCARVWGLVAGVQNSVWV